ncbi:hypothetical protein CA85_16030 [Allorhodopirellula solitaria]|uniref:DUF4340 domain-containing protein n=2 Tax=Allorhodopirellula solitaria TaxID=2527987 RepID=A0A5C5YBQ9_9BACT|nr:hypothetical protein CA85_16030 [Allorhodopirellula solitaria]
MLAVGLFVSWPASQRDETSVAAGKPLFPNFKDPLAAASVKIVSFDEAQGQVDTFEVRKDRESGMWTIPSRKGYPADAVEQMKNAANALVGLEILDVQTSNPEDHVALGVVEPKLEILEAGDIGVGRLVTFRDESQKDLASLIIGEPVKDEASRRYVRKPGQDPVYVVELEEGAVSTKFQTWIEKDLLQLSSIDIKSMQIEDYAASMSPRGGVALDRNYSAELAADGTQWRLEQLLEYPSDEALAEPVEVAVGPDQVVNQEKIDDLKNALDELEIVDVVRKPDGMSANLRADKSLISDNEAVNSLATRGFFPVQAGANAEVEVLSANGELDVTLTDGVQYVLRFGNVFGLADEDSGGEDEESSETAVNRYMLVTARVDESQFPAPDLLVVPQSIEELAAMLGESAEKEEAPPAEEPQSETMPADGESTPAEESTPADSDSEESTAADDAEMTQDAADESTPPAEQSSEETSEEPTEEAPAEEEESPADSEAAEMEEQPAETEETDSGDEPAPADEEPAEAAGEEEPAMQDQPASEADAEEDAASDEQPAEDQPAKEETPVTEEIEVDGSGEATGEGQGQAQDDASPEPADESGDSAASSPATETPADAEAPANTEAPADAEAESGEITFADLTEEEQFERLEAEQEKILKANTRLLDARKDRLNAAARRVSDLNARFADWYYVIPEQTYRKLRINRDELLTSPEAAAAAAQPAAPGGPSMPFQIPGGLTAPR